MTPGDAWDAMERSAAVVTPPSGNLERLCEWDACQPLNGRQERFASAACRVAWWKRENPRVSPNSFQREGTILELLIGCLSDGAPRTIQEIAEEVHALPCSVSARIRDARKRGHNILRDKQVGDSHGQHTYRLVV